MGTHEQPRELSVIQSLRMDVCQRIELTCAEQITHIMLMLIVSSTSAHAYVQVCSTLSYDRLRPVAPHSSLPAHVSSSILP